jgi:hypothetical protein
MDMTTLPDLPDFAWRPAAALLLVAAAAGLGGLVPALLRSRRRPGRPANDNEAGVGLGVVRLRLV